MIATLRFVHILALVVWIGGVVFFSFVTAPALFGALPRDMAGRATQAIFPLYYGLGTICGLVAVLSAATGLLRRPWPRLLVPEVILLVLMLVLTLYAWQGILPEASQTRQTIEALPEGPEREIAQVRFSALHRRSVIMNGAVLLLGLAAIALLSNRLSDTA